MTAEHASAAQQLNRDCDCTMTDMPALRDRLDAELGRGGEKRSIIETHPHMFSEAPVFLDTAHADEMRRIVEGIETIVGMPQYQDKVLARAPQIAWLAHPTSGVFAGFDFHMTAEGPRLIEINTNAGGAFLSIAGREAQRGCCQPADGLVAALPTARELEDQVHAMFLDEWHRARGQRPLRSIAIVDDQPGGQYLYPEFELAKKLLSARGIVARIVDARDLVIRNRRLYVGADPVDLVYNRLTDFYFTEAYSEVLRTAYVEDLAVVTPGPRAHALYADKRNLALLGDATELRGFGVPEPVISILVRGIPETREVAGDEEGWWRDRARWFFKPHGGFGSRGTYRGDKMTRRVFAEVMRGRYIAQRLTPPGERLRSSGEGKIAFKVDVRCYAHAGKIQQMAARLYQGQTTNFRTAGGGFAPVFVVDSSSVPPGRTC